MINTIEIFKKYFDASVKEKQGLTFTDKEWDQIMPEFKHLLDAMREVGNQSIDLCAELAKNKAQKAAILGIKKQIE